MLLFWLLAYRTDNLWLYAGLGAAAGVYLFYHGFRILQRRRLILNTPTSKVRSAAMGLVEVSGLAAGPYTITAPLTGKACYYYRTLAWELRKSGKSQQWHKVAEENLHVPFYLDDNTGRLLVNPKGAEMDIHCDFREEYSSSMFFGREMTGNVHSFLARHAVSSEHKIKVEEYCIKPKNALFILGTLAENPGVAVSPEPVASEAEEGIKFSLSMRSGVAGKLAGQEAMPRIAISKTLTIGSRHAGSDQAEREVIQLSPEQKPASSGEMTQQGKIAAALMRAGITKPAAWAAAGISDPATAMSVATSPAPAPENGADATANPAAEQFELHPKVVLMKGEHNRVFFISWRSQREVLQSLGWKAAACIWGGPALALVCLYIVMASFGWI